MGEGGTTMSRETRFKTNEKDSSKWEIVHECDDENGNPTQWCREINHPKYGKYVWISNMGPYFAVEVDHGGFIELVQCKTLTSAKRWVTRCLL